MSRIPGPRRAPSTTKRHCEDCSNFGWPESAVIEAGEPKPSPTCELLDMRIERKSRICAHFKLASWIPPTREEAEAMADPPHMWPRWSGDTFEKQAPLITYEGSSDFASLKIIEKEVRRLCKEVYKCEPNVFSCGCPETRLCHGACKCPKCGESVCFCDLSEYE